MRWLIAEDALRDRKGHWFEYVRTFRSGLNRLGDEVTVLADKQAEAFIRNELSAQAVLPESIWHRMSDGAGALRRYMRLPIHAVKTWYCVRRVLRTDADYDIVFVPTVSVHHLLAWTKLIKSRLLNGRTRVLLYFLHMPVREREDGSFTWDGSPTSRLMFRLFGRLRNEVESGKVVLGVETIPLRDCISRLIKLPVYYLPQPVESFTNKLDLESAVGPLMACYGAARHEKGSDLLQAGVLQYRQRHPASKVRFAIQWLEDFRDENGDVRSKLPVLENDSRIEFITRYFKDGEYFNRLAATHVVLLPYRLSSYRLRGSRVAIEAMVNGIPVIATSGSSFSFQVSQFGAGVNCHDLDVGSLATAIRQAELDLEVLTAEAKKRTGSARSHFSVSNFRNLLPVIH